MIVREEERGSYNSFIVTRLNTGEIHNFPTLSPSPNSSLLFWHFKPSGDHSMRNYALPLRELSVAHEATLEIGKGIKLLLWSLIKHPTRPTSLTIGGPTPPAATDASVPRSMYQYVGSLRTFLAATYLASSSKLGVHSMEPTTASMAIYSAKSWSTAQA